MRILTMIMSKSEKTEDFDDENEKGQKIEKNYDPDNENELMREK